MNRSSLSLAWAFSWSWMEQCFTRKPQILNLFSNRNNISICKKDFPKCFCDKWKTSKLSYWVSFQSDVILSVHLVTFVISMQYAFLVLIKLYCCILHAFSSSHSATFPGFHPFLPKFSSLSSYFLLINKTPVPVWT